MCPCVCASACVRVVIWERSRVYMVTSQRLGRSRVYLATFERRERSLVYLLASERLGRFRDCLVMCEPSWALSCLPGNV